MIFLNDNVIKAIPEITEWYKKHQRPLPWRVEPTPYHVWISEIMLQQTRIEAVIPYYHRFIAELPDIKSLANADEEVLMKLWQGLGYYSRVRNLQKAAKTVCSEYGGELPKEAEKLRKLAGIGDYTAGAISSIAYGQPEPAVDGNVLRVCMRIAGCYEDIMQPSVKKEVSSYLKKVYPIGENAGCFTQGIMELGETVCIPNGAPLCDECPVNTVCFALQNEETEKLPIRSEKKARKIEQRTVFVLKHGESYALRKRPPKGLLADLWEFPNIEGTVTQKEIKNMFPAVNITELGGAKHIFTHIEWHMKGFLIETSKQLDGYEWVNISDIKKRYAIPNAFRYYSDKIM